MEILNHQAFSDKKVVYIEVTVDAHGLSIEASQRTVTYPTNRPSPRMGNHPVPCNGCHFVIGGSSVSAKFVWGVAGGLQETVKDCSPLTPFPPNRGFWVCLARERSRGHGRDGSERSGKGQGFPPGCQSGSGQLG